MALSFAHAGLPIVVVNPTFPFGEGDRAPTPTGGVLLDVLRRRSPGLLEGGFNAVDVEDVAEGHVLAEERGRVGERYILGNRNITFREFGDLIREATGRPVPTRVIPYPIYWGIASIAELVSDHVTHKPPITTKKAVKYIHRLLYHDPSKARRDRAYYDLGKKCYDMKLDAGRFTEMFALIERLENQIGGKGTDQGATEGVPRSDEVEEKHLAGAR